MNDGVLARKRSAATAPTSTRTPSKSGCCGMGECTVYSWLDACGDVKERSTGAREIRRAEQAGRQQERRDAVQPAGCSLREQRAENSPRHLNSTIHFADHFAEVDFTEITEKTTTTGDAKA